MKNITLGTKLNIYLIGNNKVGKTLFINKLINNESIEYCKTEFESVTNYESSYNDHKYEIYITDSIGLDINNLDIDFFIQENNMFILIFSYKDINTLKALNPALDRIIFIKENIDNNILILGNNYSNDIDNISNYNNYINENFKEIEKIDVENINEKVSYDIIQNLMKINFEKKLKAKIRRQLIREKSYFNCY